MEKKIIRKSLVAPRLGEDFINFKTKEKIRFLLYTMNDIEKFEEVIESIDEEKLFRDIDVFKREKQKVFKIGNQDFKYTEDYLGMGQCFMITDETSTWDKEYNS